MSCSRTQHDAACGDQTPGLSILSPTLYHYATALPYLLCVMPYKDLELQPFVYSMFAYELPDYYKEVVSVN